MFISDFRKVAIRIQIYDIRIVEPLPLCNNSTEKENQYHGICTGIHPLLQYRVATFVYFRLLVLSLQKWRNGSIGSLPEFLENNGKISRSRNEKRLIVLYRSNNVPYQIFFYAVE